jgi:vacuolar-type H+-ATPase subunit H
MNSVQQSEDLAAKAADAVRSVITEAEDHAAEIIREAEEKAGTIREQAESDAKQVRARAEADARKQIDAAKRALDELGGTLAAAASEAVSNGEEPEPESDPDEEPKPESEPGQESDDESEQPSESPGAPEAPVSSNSSNNDEGALRLVAMKLAVDGFDRREIEAELNTRFGNEDRSTLLDDVLSRAHR